MLTRSAELAERLESEKQRDFGKNREYIEFAIEREIKRKLFGDAGSYEVSLRADTQAQAAVDSFTGTDLAAFAEAVSAAGIGLFGDSTEP